MTLDLMEKNLEAAQESIRKARALIDQKRLRVAFDMLAPARDTLKDVCALLYREEKKRLDRERMDERKVGLDRACDTDSRRGR
jgi:hypothetical protein